MIILDTNIVSALMRDPPDAIVLDWLDQQPRTSIWTTVITVLESQFGIGKLPAGRRRDILAREFDRVIIDDLEGRVLNFDQASAEQTAALMLRRQAEGRPGDLRDSMIAGIALARHATIVTRNIKHFKDAEISVVNPGQA
jgi:predicted nucleic acid-binding protein